MIEPVNRETVLIIDDQERSRSLYRALLLREGYEVLEAETGERGLELVKSAKPDVIILDLFLPTLSGSDVLERIRADDSTKKIPIIVLSVEGEKAAIQKVLQLGAQDYLVKGFTPPKEVLSKLRTVMQKAGAKSPAPSYKLRIIEGQVDAPKLEQDFGLPSPLLCPQCNLPLTLDLVPNGSRSDGAWFLAHFVCPNCGRAF